MEDDIQIIATLGEGDNDPEQVIIDVNFLDDWIYFQFGDNILWFRIDDLMQALGKRLKDID